MKKSNKKLITARKERTCQGNFNLFKQGNIVNSRETQLYKLEKRKDSKSFLPIQILVSQKEILLQNLLPSLYFLRCLFWDCGDQESKA